MFGQNITDNENYTSIVNDRHLKRIQDILTDAQAKGARVIPCDTYSFDQQGRRMPVQIVLNCTPDMRIMKEELFGPILPVVAYDSLDDAITYVKSDERPLALYCFTHSSVERDRILRETHSGGVTINDWGWHVVNHDAPFGVSATQVWGHIMAKKVSANFHMQNCFIRHRFFPTQLFHPPYGTFLQN